MLNVEYVERRIIPALRSNTYLQGMGELCVLKKGAKHKLYCALGVMVDCLIQDKILPAWEPFKLVGNDPRTCFTVLDNINVEFDERDKEKYNHPHTRRVFSSLPTKACEYLGLGMFGQYVFTNMQGELEHFVYTLFGEKDTPIKYLHGLNDTTGHSFHAIADMLQALVDFVKADHDQQTRHTDAIAAA